MEAQPNAAHYALAKLEEKYDVTVITQNIDDLLTVPGAARKIVEGLAVSREHDLDVGQCGESIK